MQGHGASHFVGEKSLEQEQIKRKVEVIGGGIGKGAGKQNTDEHCTSCRASCQVANICKRKITQEKRSRNNEQERPLKCLGQARSWDMPYHALENACDRLALGTGPLLGHAL